LKLFKELIIWILPVYWILVVLRLPVLLRERVRRKLGRLSISLMILPQRRSNRLGRKIGGLKKLVDFIIIHL